MRQIKDLQGLESVVGARPLAMMMKSIDRLDDHCRAVIDRSTAAVIAYRDECGLRARLVGVAPGFAWDSPTSLAIDAPDGAVAGTPVGACFLTPGWRETLRVNGTFSSSFDVSEALVHCGKAVVRSKLWDVPTETSLDNAARAFLAAAPFLIIGSCDADGNADASPKGDPGGFVHAINDATIAIPDRKGNRRTDTFHNVLDDPTVAILALRPGDDRILELGGRARISTGCTLLRPRDSAPPTSGTPTITSPATTCRRRRASGPTTWSRTGPVDWRPGESSSRPGRPRSVTRAPRQGPL
jgi:uncharacterized protein